MMKHLILILSLMLLPAAAHAQCTTNNNSNFTLSGTNNATLSSTTPLSQGQYTVGVVPTVPGTSNSGTTCYPVLITSGVANTGNCASDGTAGGRGMPPSYPYSSNGAVTVNWNDCYQVIDGWGADFNRNWSAQTSPPGAGVTLGGMQGVYTLTNGNGGPGMGLTHMRWGCLDPGYASYATAAIQCSLPIGTNVCAQANYMTQLGGTLFWTDGLLYSHYFPNFPSIFATDIPTIVSNTVTWLGQFKSQCGGATFATYSIFNEESGTFQNTSQCQGYHDFIAAMSSAFTTAGIATKFALPEESGFGNWGTATCTMNDSTTAAAVNVIDWHGYGNVSGAYPYQNLSKHGWLTEYASSVAVNGSNTTQWANAQGEITDFMNSLEWGANLVNYRVGYCPTNQNTDTSSCWAFDQGGYDTFTLAGYAYGQLSRYVRPGWHLYGSTTSPYADGSVFTLFFRSPTTNDFALVALNTATATRNLTVAFQGFAGSTVTPIETTALGAQWSQQASVAATNGFSFALPAQSVVTFTGTAGGGPPPPSNATISVNGSSSGVTAAAGSLLTVAAANGPGNLLDWMGICSSGVTPSSAACDAQFNWAYLATCGVGTPPPTTSPVTSNTCNLTAPSPSTTTNYVVNFFSNSGYTVLASAPLTVTGGGGPPPGNPGTPYGNIPCPRGCTWTVAFADDFTVDTSFSYDRTANVTNALWYVPPDGSGNPTACTGATNCTYACDQGALDTSHLPGYLAFHAVGTLAWETSNNLSCGIFPKVSTTYTPVGCSDGWYTQSCIPIPGPAIYEYKAQLAVNQIFEVQACCAIELYFYESRGNGTSFNGGIPHVIGGESVEVGSPVVELDRAPVVVDVLVDPQSGYYWYTDGQLVFSANPGNCPSGTCDGLTSTYYMFNDAISNACGGACSPGGTTQLYWVKEFRGY